MITGCSQDGKLQLLVPQAEDELNGMTTVGNTQMEGCLECNSVAWLIGGPTRDRGGYKGDECYYFSYSTQVMDSALSA